MRRFKILFISCLAFLGLLAIFPESAMAQSTGGDVQQINTFIKRLAVTITAFALTDIISSLAIETFEG